MRSVCFVDTSTLINLHGIEVARKDVGLWLWDEFDVVVSAAVAGEIRNHLRDRGPNGRAITRKAQRCTWGFTTRVEQYEAALMRILGQASVPAQSSIIHPSKNRGERHNLLAGLDAVRDTQLGRIRHIVFLCDDEKANRFVGSVFETFPFGCVWSSHDLILYLFFRHRKRFTRSEAEDAIRSVNATASSSAQNEKWMTRFHEYVDRVNAIDHFLANLP